MLRARGVTRRDKERPRQASCTPRTFVLWSCDAGGYTAAIVVGGRARRYVLRMVMFGPLVESVNLRRRCAESQPRSSAQFGHKLSIFESSWSFFFCVNCYE